MHVDDSGQDHSVFPLSLTKLQLRTANRWYYTKRNSAPEERKK